MLKTGQDPFLYLINSLSMHFELFCKLLEKDFFELFGFVKTLPRLRNALTPIAGVFFCRNHFSLQHRHTKRTLRGKNAEGKPQTFIQDTWLYVECMMTEMNSHIYGCTTPASKLNTQRMIPSFSLQQLLENRSGDLLSVAGYTVIVSFRGVASCIIQSKPGKEAGS